MDFDNRKVYGDTSITDGLVYIYRVFFLTGPQGPGNFQGPELLAAPGIFQGGPYLRSDTLCHVAPHTQVSTPPNLVEQDY